MQQNTGMSKLDEIKKLKECIEELEFVKDFQQDIIADMEIITRVDKSKKSLPKILAKEIALKKKNISKENGAISILGFLNKSSTKILEIQENKQVNHEKLIVMVQNYRKQVGKRTGGIKLHTKLKQDYIKQDIKIGRDRFYNFLRIHNLLVSKFKNYLTTTNSDHQIRNYKT
jgi:hypothetical protein